MERPDRYIIVKITNEGTDDLYKVFATWIGGYLGNDAWRMNSGIVSVRDEDAAFMFVGASGSEYDNLYAQENENN